MGSALRVMSGPAVDRKADMAAILTALEPSDVLFIDEIHRLNRAIEELLYPAMEDGCIDIVIGQGPGAHSIRLDLAPFTLVGATTRTGLLTTPLRDRFGITHRLDYYAAGRDRAASSAARLGSWTSSIDDGGVHRDRPPLARHAADRQPHPAPRARLSPRCAARARSTREVALEALDLFEVDRAGLERIDRAILARRRRHASRAGRSGCRRWRWRSARSRTRSRTSTSRTCCSSGLLQRTPRGRVVTAAGYAHLGLPAPARDPRLF